MYRYSLPSFTESSTQLKNLGTMTLFLDGILNEETDYTLPLYNIHDASLNGAEVEIISSLFFKKLFHIQFRLKSQFNVFHILLQMLTKK